MAKIVTDDKHYRNIAEAIRENGLSVETMVGKTRPDEMAGKVYKVAAENFDNGVIHGYDDGYSEGLQEGYDEGEAFGHAIGYNNGKLDGETGLLTGLQGCNEFVNEDITFIAPYVLAAKNDIEVIRLPSLKESLGGSVFRECEKLREVYLPKYASDSNGYMFAACPALEYVDFGSPVCVSRYAFRNCTALKTIVLRRTDKIVSLSNPNALEGVSGVTIYVPSEVIGKYKGATNWAGLVSASKVTFADLKGSGYE